MKILGLNISKAKNLLPVLINPDLPKKDANKLITAYHLPRVRQDIGNWREAMQEMERRYVPYRVKSQILYQDVAINGHFFACMRKRKDMVMLKKWAIVDENNNINEKWTAWITQKWFKDLLSYSHDAICYGYSFINWTGIENNRLKNLHLIQRQFISPDRNQIAMYPYAPVGKDIDDKDLLDWTLYVPTPSDHGISPCGYGLFYSVGIYEIILRNLLGQNTDFVELFSQPIRWAKSTKREGEEYDMLERAMKDMGSSAYIITDPTDEIALLQSNSIGPSYQSFADLEQRCEKKISKILLGHADAMDSVPGKLGSGQGGKDKELTPVQQALADTEASDIEFITSVLNDSFIDKMRNIGFDIQTGLKFAVLNDKEEVEIKKQQDEQLGQAATYAKTFHDAGLKIPAEWLKERYDVPFEEVAAPVAGNETEDDGEPAFNSWTSPRNPYPSEHAARIIEPSKFDSKTFRRKNIAKGIDIIIGELKPEYKK